MKKHDTRWNNVWGEVRKSEIDGQPYFDFILWAGHHYVRHTVSGKQLELYPDMYERIFEMLIDKVSLSMQKGGWFG